MDLLLDTHTLIWWMWGSGRLGRRAFAELVDSKNRKFLSAASVWEMSIKASRGRLHLDEPLLEWIPKMLSGGLEPLPINLYHAYAIRALPLIHGDPFDRMLVAQALAENCTLVSGDGVLARYGAPVVWE